MTIEGVEGEIEFAAVAGFFAAEGIGVAFGVADGADGGHGAGGGVLFEDGFGLAIFFEADVGGFHGEDALEAPVADGHAFDEGAFDGAGGAVVGVEGVEDGDEAFGGFVIEDDGGGEDAVTVGVAGGDDFAERGCGAGGFLGVGLVGGEFAFGDFHTGEIIREGRKGFWVKWFVLLEKIVELRLGERPD